MALPAGLVLGLVFLVYALLGFAPFGNASAAYMDADIQYLDLHAFLKAVLAGEDSLAYTFGKTLGGTALAIYSYYLASPFSLLVRLFPKTEMHSFLDCLIACKLAMAAAFCSFFLQKRFRELPAFALTALSVSYALMQYSLAQSSNVMWLDGVYMLPLILTGVFWAAMGRGCLPLAAFMGCSILFNWYTGCINALFAALWFLLETGWIWPDREKGLRAFLAIQAKRGLAAAGAVVWGAALGAVLLVPTLLSLSNGRAESELHFFSFAMLGNPFDTAAGFALGSHSSSSAVSLYCGGFALLGCVLFFAAPGEKRSRKIWAGACLATGVMLFYWQPFFFLFSLLKSSTSFWFRYSYGIILLLIFLAASFYTRKEAVKGPWLPLAAAGAAGAATMAGAAAKAPERLACAAGAALCLLLTAAVLLRRQTRRSTIRKAASLASVALVLAELGLNASLLWNDYRACGVAGFQAYVRGAQAQQAALAAYDGGVYRISHTSARNAGQNRLTANYNEALAFGYWSISGYTSDPDARQLALLQRLGYRQNGDNMCIVATSVLSADALLGVKYVVSPFAIQGLVPVEGLPGSGSGAVYENPYCLPFAVKYDATAPLGEAQNSFESNNALYSQLCGREVELFQRVDFTKEEAGNALRYELAAPAENQVLYGLFSWEEDLGATLHFSDGTSQGYARWLSPSVFYIPAEAGAGTASFTLTAEELPRITKEEIYALDLDLLQQVTQELKARGSAVTQVKNGFASFVVTAREGESLEVAIPYSSGWRITRNGEAVRPALFADCFYSIPLAAGENRIEMRYTVPGLREGSLISALALGALCAAALLCRKRRI